MNKNIFVTAIGGDIACSALRCIQENYDYNKIIGCDISEYVQGALYVDEFILAPSYSNTKNYIDFVMQVCIDYEVTHFLPMSETEIQIINKYRHFFKEHNIALMINNELILDIAMSKYKTAHFLNDNNVLAPKTYYSSQYSKQLAFPVIIKPDTSCGSKSIYVVKNELEYQYACETSTTNNIIQQYIGNSDEEYTAGVFSNGIDIKTVVFKRKLGLGGMSVFVETYDDPKLTAICKGVASLFRLKGSINIQLRKADNQYYIFEINPRLSSTVGFRHKLGFQDVIWWLNMLDGKDINLDIQISGGIKGIKTTNEIIFKQV